jgi:MFS family permease
MIRETLAPLKLAGFRMLLAGRTVNAFGNAFAPIALAFAVLDLTGSAADLGLVVGARTLVNVIFLLFGGALADRLPKNLLMVGAAIAAAATQGAVAALVLTDTATVPLLIGLAAANGVVSALSMPASSAIVPQLVPADLRQQANGLGRLAFNGASIIGAPIGGVVVASVGPGWGIVVDAVTFLLAALCFALVRIPARPPQPVGADDDQPAAALIGAEQTAGEPVAPPPVRANIITDLRTGWSEFISRTWLWVVVAGFCVVNAALSGGFMVLGPVIADQTIGRQAWGFVLAAETAGMIIGAVVAMRIKFRRLLLFGVVCTAAEALPLLTLGVYPHLGLMLAAGFITGLAIEQFGIAWETTMQEHVPADKLARVYSYDMVGSFVAIPVGQTLAGPIAEAVGVEATLIGAAGLILLAVLGMLTSRDVRHLPHRLPSKDATPVEELPA